MIEYVILGVLGGLSLISLTFIIERSIALQRAKVIPEAVLDAADRFRTREELHHLKDICMRHPAPLSRLLIAASEHLDWPKDENVSLLETRARREVNGLERGLVFLEIATGIAPLLGLVGTIYGMIALFASLGVSGATDSAAFASGISIALKATLFGLLVAIPSLIAWSYLSRRVESLAVELESRCDDFIRRFYRDEILADRAQPAPVLPAAAKV